LDFPNHSSCGNSNSHMNETEVYDSNTTLFYIKIASPLDYPH
jgi:hypothetical protein